MLPPMVQLPSEARLRGNRKCSASAARLHLRQGDAGVHRQGHAAFVQRADAVQPLGGQQHFAMQGNLSAHQPGIAALRYQRRAGFMADAQDGGDFGRAGRLEQQRRRPLIFAAPFFQMRRDLAGSSLKPLAPTASFSRSSDAHRGAAARMQAVVDGLADAGVGNGRDGDVGGALVQFAQHGEQIGGGFPEVAARAEIQLGARRIAKAQQHFAGFDLAGIQPQARRAARNGWPSWPGERIRLPGAPSGPIMSSISSRGMAPGRSSSGRSPSKPITVDSMPRVALPASRMKSTLPVRLSATCWAVVAVTWPDVLAEGPATGPAGFLQQRDGGGMRGRAQRHAVQPGADQQRQRRILAARQHQGQGAGPEFLRQRLGAGRQFDMAPRFFEIGDMHDQRIEQRAALGGEDRGHRFAIGGVGAQAVNRLGGEGDQPAVSQDAGGFGNAGGVGGGGFGLEGRSWRAIKRLGPDVEGRDVESKGEIRPGIDHNSANEWRIIVSLAGKTLFITGGSRGIGLAIALRAARDGANIAIAAKTDRSQSQTAGNHLQRRGRDRAGGRQGAGHSLRHPLRGAGAWRPWRPVSTRFGGIDICVNNASAISLTGTEATEMKRFDLMHQVNARGTFLVSKTCVPHLRKSANPHVLMLSPPLDMKRRDGSRRTPPIPWPNTA